MYVLLFLFSVENAADYNLQKITNIIPKRVLGNFPNKDVKC